MGRRVLGRRWGRLLRSRGRVDDVVGGCGWGRGCGRALGRGGRGRALGSLGRRRGGGERRAFILARLPRVSRGGWERGRDPVSRLRVDFGATSRVGRAGVMTPTSRRARGRDDDGPRGAARNRVVGRQNPREAPRNKLSLRPHAGTPPRAGSSLASGRRGMGVFGMPRRVPGASGR